MLNSNYYWKRVAGGGKKFIKTNVAADKTH
jgi:hypothetical protein